MTETYNGWKNRETWLANLWYMDNSSEFLSDAENVDQVASNIRQFVEYDISHAKDIIFGEYGENVVSGFVRNLLPSMDEIVSKIDFDELAEAATDGKLRCDECEEWFEKQEHRGKFVSHYVYGELTGYTCGNCVNEEDWS